VRDRRARDRIALLGDLARRPEAEAVFFEHSPGMCSMNLKIPVSVHWCSPKVS
jgi:hypothetical protein